MIQYGFRMKLMTGGYLRLYDGSTTIPVHFIHRNGELSSITRQMIGAGQRLVIKASGYKSERSAWHDALRLKDALMLGGASSFGVNMGTESIGAQLASTLIAKLQEDFGITVRNNVHGIDVYAENNVAHLVISAVGFVDTNLEDFVGAINRNGDVPLSSGHVRTGVELINDSLFPMPDEARFLLRISAIEALCEQSKRSKSVVELLNQLMEASKDLSSDQDALKEVRDVLMRARRQSVRQACLGKIRFRLGREVGRQFYKLYGLRSSYLHEGEGRTTLREPATEALEVANNLVRAEIGNVTCPS